jgi:alcohol dehydrogenase, propanol-preferring
MRAMVLREFGKPLQLEERPVPEIGPDEVLIRVKACGTGLTLKWFRSGIRGGVLPRITGHEVGGIVEKAGSLVTECKTADRVTVSFYLFCGHCKFCVTGHETLCENLKGHIGVNIDGGYSEFMKVPGRNAVLIPDGIGYAEAGITADAIATPWHVAKERAKIKPNDNVLVVGAGGGVGIHMVQVAKIFGARVIGVDVSDEKLDVVKKYGADEVINVKSKNMAAEVKKLTGGKGVEIAVDMVGMKATLEGAVDSLAVAGTLVVVGAWPGATIEVNPRDLSQKEIILTGNRYATRQEIRESLELVRRGLVKPVILNTFPLEQANKAHQLIDEMKLTGRAALIIAE